MRLVRFVSIVLLVVFGALSLAAQAPTPARKRVLFIGESKGWHHESVSHAMGTIWKLGQDTGLWDTYLQTDTELVTRKKVEMNAKNLNYFDAVIFYTSGELDMDDSQKADLLSFVKDDGKGFMGVHSASDTFYKWPEYGEMIGGYFDQHPWMTFQAPLVVEDVDFPGMSAVPKAFTMRDEIYQVKDFSRDKVRVLMSLDAGKLDLQNKNVHRTDKDFAVIWVRSYGKGRVMYDGLGHVEGTWDRPDIQKMLIEHMKWLLGMQPGNTTPRPKPAM